MLVASGIGFPFEWDWWQARRTKQIPCRLMQPRARVILPALMLPTLYPPEVKEKAFQLFCERVKMADIAARLGVKLSTVAKWSSVHGWRARYCDQQISRGREMVAAHPPKAAPSSSASPEILDEGNGLDGNLRADSKLSLGESQSEYQTRMQAQALRVPALMQRLSDAGLLASAEKLAKLDGIARKALRLETDKPAVVVNIGLLSSSEPPRRLKSCAVASELPALEITTEEEDAGATPAATDEPSELPGAERKA